MYFEGISACVSLTTKHVYCVTPCQLNRLLLLFCHYCIDIKIGKISLDEQAHAQHHPFQDMFRAKGEGGVSERSPNNQLSSR